jgi:hypothetical protein
LAVRVCVSGTIQYGDLYLPELKYSVILCFFFVPMQRTRKLGRSNRNGRQEGHIVRAFSRGGREMLKLLCCFSKVFHFYHSAKHPGFDFRNATVNGMVINCASSCHKLCFQYELIDEIEAYESSSHHIFKVPDPSKFMGGVSGL